MEFKWNEAGLNKVTGDVMREVATRGRQRLRHVMCPVHGSRHQVVWEVHGSEVTTRVTDACCDELKQTLYAETKKAIG